MSVRLTVYIRSFYDTYAQKVKCKRNVPTEQKKKRRKKWASVNGKRKFQGQLIARKRSFVALFCD